MTEIVAARPAAVRSPADADLSGNHVKDPTDLPFVQPSIISRAKEVRGLPNYEEAVPAGTVVGEDLEARRGKGDQAGLAELGVTDRKNPFGPVDIGRPYIERLTDAKPGHRQKSE